MDPVALEVCLVDDEDVIELSQDDLDRVDGGRIGGGGTGAAAE